MAKLVRLSTIVSRIPSIWSLGFNCRLTLLMVDSSCSRPLAGRYSAWTGTMILLAVASALTVSIPREGWQSMRIWEYCPFTVSRYCRRIVSRLMAFTRDTSMPESWMSAGIRSTPSGWCRMPSPGLIGSSMRIRPIASDRVKGSLSGCGLPRLMVRLACGSASTSSTFFPACASPMPKLAQVVVLPTPPFWLATAMICGFNDFTSFLIGCCHVPA